MNLSERSNAAKIGANIIKRHFNLINDPVQIPTNTRIQGVCASFAKELGFINPPQIFDSSGLGLPWHAAKSPKWMQAFGLGTGGYIFVDYNFLIHENAPPLALEVVIAHELGHLLYSEQGKHGHDFKNRNLKDELEADAVSVRLCGAEATFDLLMFLMISGEKGSENSYTEIVTRQRALSKRCFKTAAKWETMIDAAQKSRTLEKETHGSL